MGSFIQLVVCFIVGRHVLAAPEANWRIIGGSSATPGQFPHQISLRFNGFHGCGGAILDEYTICTAAHCVMNADPKTLTVVTGSNSLKQGGVVHKVANYTSHPDFEIRKNILNDIAIIKLTTPIKFGAKTKPISLPESDTLGDEDCYLSGWGTMELGGRTPDLLQFIKLRTLDFDTCKKNQTTFEIFPSELCTFTKSGEGACHGDSGGPLINTRNQLIGVVSWGTPCAKGYPDVFTRVWWFIHWIIANK